MEVNKIYNEDCMKTMERLHDIDCVITSPPYNTSRKGSSLTDADSNIRYDEFDDCRPNEEYIEWTCDIFRGFDKCLKPNGSVLYNLSYSAENIALMVAVLLLTSCENFATRNFGGSQTIELEKGQRLVEITFKDNDLWILTEPMDSDYVPKTKTFYEDSNLGVMQGKITIVESK